MGVSGKVNGRLVMQLEDGKTYLDRDGNKITVTHRGSGLVYSFIGNNRYTYLENGRWIENNYKSNNDLIALAQEEPVIQSPAPLCLRYASTGRKWTLTFNSWTVPNVIFGGDIPTLEEIIVAACVARNNLTGESND
jgi:hypothetical protein